MSHRRSRGLQQRLARAQVSGGGGCDKAVAGLGWQTEKSF